MQAFRLPAVLFLVAAAVSGPVRAADDLNSAIVYVTGQYEETRLPGFARALEEVLVKTSGNARLAGDPRVAAIAANASGYVESFSYRDRMAGIPVHDEQGTRQRPYALTVVFADDTIAALLTQLGETRWLDRPDVMVFTTVATGGTRYTLTSDGEHGRDFREALAAEARRTGLIARLPAETDTAAAATVAAGTIVLRGAIAWDDAAGGWIARWEFASGGDNYAWRVAGVSFDGAFRSGLGGVAQVLSGHGAPE